jgi:hypothetical protein
MLCAAALKNGQQKAPSSLTGLGDVRFSTSVKRAKSWRLLSVHPRQQRLALFIEALFSRKAVSAFRNHALENLQVLSAGLAAHLVNLGFVRNLLSFGEAGQASTLDSADVNEHIGAAVVRLNETEAFLAVEPLHSTSRHNKQFL